MHCSWDMNNVRGAGPKKKKHRLFGHKRQSKWSLNIVLESVIMAEWLSPEGFCNTFEAFRANQSSL